MRDLKEKPGSDVAKLSNNEAKLTAARQRLQEATGKLYKGFGYYDAVGGTLCQPEVEMLKKAQQGFFGSAYTVVRVSVCLSGGCTTSAGVPGARSSEKPP